MFRRDVLGTIATISTALLSACLENDEAPTESPTRTADEDSSTQAVEEESSDWKDQIEFDDVDREVYVEARSYYFTPGTDEPIRVEAGETIGLGFCSKDDGYHAGHGLSITEYDVELKASEHELDATTFVADEAGEFEMFCNVYCSDGHDEMTGTLRVD